MVYPAAPARARPRNGLIVASWEMPVIPWHGMAMSGPVRLPHAHTSETSELLAVQNSRTHRRPEVVAHLVRHGHVRDRGRDRLAVVQEGDDARVQALQAAAVVLQRGGSKHEWLNKYWRGGEKKGAPEN